MKTFWQTCIPVSISNLLKRNNWSSFKKSVGQIRAAFHDKLLSGFESNEMYMVTDTWITVLFFSAQHSHQEFPYTEVMRGTQQHDIKSACTVLGGFWHTLIFLYTLPKYNFAIQKLQFLTFWQGFHVMIIFLWWSSKYYHIKCTEKVLCFWRNSFTLKNMTYQCCRLFKKKFRDTT